MRDALTNRITEGGLNVVRLHYASDPDKDPSTPQGAEWVQSQLKGYPGGFENRHWRQEMEIMYSAGGGELVFRRFSDWRVASNIFIEPGPDVSGAKLYGSYDHGWTNPAAYLVHAVYPGGLKRTIWECYGSEIPSSKMAEIILGRDVMLADGRTFEGNPYAGQEIMRIADPEINRATAAMYEGPNKSLSRIFLDHGVHFTMGERGDDSMVANWLLGNLWEDPMAPTYQICTNCTYLIWEMGRLRYPKATAERNNKERMIDRDNHAWDALKYFMKRFPVASSKKEKPDTTATFDWWAKIADNHRTGKSIPTYRRRVS